MCAMYVYEGLNNAAEWYEVVVSCFPGLHTPPQELWLDYKGLVGDAKGVGLLENKGSG